MALAAERFRQEERDEATGRCVVVRWSSAVQVAPVDEHEREFPGRPGAPLQGSAPSEGSGDGRTPRLVHCDVGVITHPLAGHQDVSPLGLRGLRRPKILTVPALEPAQSA
ncbi:hypothetical protein GCM10027162_42320 [Streptomyces incanus]